jgi:UDP-glucuronate decarboxylase
MDYHRQNNIRIKIVRIFNTYGPRMNQNDGRVVSNFIVQALKGEDITIFGDGSHTRSFQYIDDLVNGMIKMMNSEEEFIGPVNLGNPEEFRIVDLAKKIIDMTGSGSKIIYLSLPEDDPKQRQPDITLAREKLNWLPVVSLETGLKRTIDYFRKEIRENNK